MSRLFSIKTCFLALIIASTPLTSFAAEPAGKTILARGDVQAISGDKSRKLRRRSPIFNVDIVKTGANSRAQLRMTDGGMVALQENTQLEIAKYEYDAEVNEGSAVMNLISGGIRTVTGKLKAENGDYKLDTPVGSIGIRGTHYEVEIVGNDLFVAVWDGAIDMELNVGGNEVSLSLGENADFNYVKVTPEGEIEPFTEIPDNFKDGHTANANDAPSDNEEEQDNTQENEQQDDGQNQGQQNQQQTNNAQANNQQQNDGSEGEGEGEQQNQQGDEQNNSQQNQQQDGNDNQTNNGGGQANNEQPAENQNTNGDGGDNVLASNNETPAEPTEPENNQNTGNDQANSSPNEPAQQPENQVVQTDTSVEVITDKNETDAFDLGGFNISVTTTDNETNPDDVANTNDGNSNQNNQNNQNQGQNAPVVTNTDNQNPNSNPLPDEEPEFDPNELAKDDLVEDIVDRTGTATFDVLSSNTISSSVGEVTNIKMSMDVNFDALRVNNGRLSFNDAEGEWFAAFDGVITSNTVDLGVNHANHGEKLATGTIDGIFGASGEQINGNISLQEVEDESKKASGSYTLDEAGK
ncbi:hypothetical protein C2869_11360 [Saccharobesus litoralis]|uniref:FecR protein domain-containing protein n=1 Tax=Saccharobesus litoralis TaxID=2172099 RepID=A0A2S0VS10_9ALTE|nr:FecR family protein [Saccharobesus litoralis]AWB66997.1 hypothetical protein C2869_11360 [Saccharobesus litoralis]